MAEYLKQSFLREVEDHVKMGNISYGRMCEIIQDEVISNYTKTRYDTKEELLKTMNWISTKDKLPEEGKYVLARHNRGTWNDSNDQENVNCVVVKLVKGLSKKDRQLMKEGKLPSTKEGGTHYNCSRDTPIYTESERCNIYKSEDEDGNNLVPYKWEMFGPDSFFGQTITHWMPIEPLK